MIRKLDEEATASTADIRAVIPPEKTQGSGLNLPTMLLGAFCVVLAIIAIVLAAVSMNRQNVFNIGTTQGDAAGSRAGLANKTWLVMLGHDWGAHEYIDTQGNLAGFNHDLIREVCAAAGMNCRTVWDSYPNCWDSQAGQHGKGGQGLMGSWYDACTGWVRTHLRDGTFSFSQGYLPTRKAAFYVKTGNPDNFNVDDVTGKKIAFLDGWVEDEKCLARQKSITGSVLPVDKIVHVLTTDELVQKVDSGEVDAAFAMGELISQQIISSDLIHLVQLMPLTSPPECMISGPAMMTRKDNSFTTYWNQGFDKLVESGRFTQLCNEASQRHGSRGKVTCPQL